MNNNITEIEEFNRINNTNLEAKPLYKVKCLNFDTDMTDLVMTPTNFTKSILIDSKPKTVKYSGQLVIPERSEEDKKKENIERSIRRAKQMLQRKARQIGANHLLTLSTREDLPEDKYQSAYKQFVRLVREKDLVADKLVTRKEKREWLYVATDERQERGALHTHIAVNGRQDIKLLRACWYVALGGKVTDSGDQTKGQIHVRKEKKRFSGYSKVFKTMRLVAYLTKYMVKTFENDDQLGKARYKASRQIKQPTQWRQYLNATYLDGKNAFVKAVTQVIEMAYEQGLKDIEVFNRGTDLFIVRGKFDQERLFA